MIAFAAWHPINGSFLPSTDKDLMSYSWLTPQWISDFNWSKFYTRTWEQGYGFAAASSAANLLPKVKPGGVLTIGPKEAQGLADYLDAVQPTGCGGIPEAEFEAMKAQLRLAPSSSSPMGKPSVVVTSKKDPKQPIPVPVSISHTPTELEQLLGLPFVPRSRR